MNTKRTTVYERRQKLIKVLDIIKGIIFTIGVIGVIIGGCADTEYSSIRAVVIELAVSFGLILITMLIEKFMFNFLIDEDCDIEVNRIFGNTQMYEDDADYYDWLDENDLDDTDDNYDYYNNYIA